MDKSEIGRKTDELKAILVKHKSELDTLEKELLATITEYHDALRAEKLKEIKANIVNVT